MDQASSSLRCMLTTPPGRLGRWRRTWPSSCETRFAHRFNPGIVSVSWIYGVWREAGTHGVHKPLSFAAVAVVTVGIVVTGCVALRVPDPAVRYVAFGDSTTSGAAQRDYPDILRELLSETPVTFVNEGHGGETSDEGLKRLNDILESDLYPNAEVWFYWEGGNDIIEFIQAEDPLLIYSPSDADYPLARELAQQLTATRANIEAAIELLKGEGVAVYVATYFPVREGLGQCPPLPLDTLLPVQAVRANAYVRRLNQHIREAVAKQEAWLVDVAEVGDTLRLDPANYADCNHLSVQGNTIVAEVFAEALGASDR